MPSKFALGWGSAPDPVGGAGSLQRSPRPANWFKGPTFKGEGRGRGERKRNVGEGREKERRGRREEKEEKGLSAPFRKFLDPPLIVDP